ncbi:hypothetical protein RHMOL_Rhmol13G0230100 [Rhododendron molle]|uniref:Uncharacterized protein n=1 Tax=Rhododendron molle TaxID=49168 RepID=A0ACC0LA61_RHOML|nr:hypothetical protein RHMOL_Rhmol13G0230100 [Rhododendron molle]
MDVVRFLLYVIEKIVCGALVSKRGIGGHLQIIHDMLCAIPVKKLLQKGLVSAFWLSSLLKEGCFIDIKQMVGSEAYSYFELTHQPSSHTSDGSGTLLSSSTESSYNSDQGSGNEDGKEASYIIYEESSDEVDFLKEAPSKQELECQAEIVFFSIPVLQCSIYAARKSFSFTCLLFSLQPKDVRFIDVSMVPWTPSNTNFGQMRGNLWRRHAEKFLKHSISAGIRCVQLNQGAATQD